MHSYRIIRHPKSLRARHVKLDNVTLVPASLLPFKEQWQHVANELPQGSVLICIPENKCNPRQPYLAVARTLRDKGFKVRAVRAESFVGRV